jgi:hypothetical protein
MVIAYAVGGVGITYYGWCAICGLLSRHWPVTPGQVTSCRLRTLHWSGAVNYTPKVTYTYEVAGRLYTGSRVAFGPYGIRAFAPKATRLAAKRAVKRYAVGGAVEVRYYHLWPRLSVLEPGLTAQTVLGMVVILLLCLVLSG